MKIAMAHVDLPNETKGGVASQAHLLANAMVERGHDVTMFTFSPTFAACKYKVHQYKAPQKFGRAKSFLLAYRLATTDFSQFDIVHTHGDNYLLRKHPQVRTFHGSAKDEAQSARSLKRKLYQRLMIGLEALGGRTADINTGVSEATRLRIVAVSTIIPCGVDLTRFRPGEKSEKPSILFVGTVGGRKRGSMLAEAFQKEVLPLMPDAELWMVADQKIIGDGIINHGRVSEEKLVDLYQKAWVFCLPSTYEGFGVPYIEAMAAGTPVVATPNLGACEVLQDGKYGTIVPDIELGDALCSLLGDPAKRGEMARLGLQHSENYSWPSVAAQYENIYAQLQPANSYTEALASS